MMFALRMIPYGSRYCAEAFVALKKIQELLLYPEYDQQIPFCQDANIAVQFKNATFLWDNKSNFCLMIFEKYLTCTFFVVISVYLSVITALLFDLMIQMLQS